jgi:hypothetical protein
VGKGSAPAAFDPGRAVEPRGTEGRSGAAGHWARAREGCSRWAKRLFASEGYLVRGRCRSANLCAYCLMQEVHVIRRMLSLQALDGPAPQILTVLGTGEATWDPVMRALKRAFGPEVGYTCLSEFTTGKSAYSGGLRRPHWNMLLCGIGVDLVAHVRELVIPTWCNNAPNTDPAAQYVEPPRLLLRV